MGRRRRVDHAGAHLLVTNRGTAQTALYRSNRDRRTFLGLLSALEDEFGVAVLAYVLMGNHYHLVVRLHEERLPEAMQHLDGTYARRFNAVHQRSGALFGGRYDARGLDNEAGLQGAGHYVHLNPLRAGLVADPVGYRWSSLGDHVRGRSALPWLRLELLDGRSGEAYRRATMHEARSGVGTLGQAADDHAVFVDWDANRDLVEAFRRTDRVVADRFGVSIDELYIVARGRRNVARMCAIVAAFRGRGIAPAVVASRYGLRSRTAVYGVERRFRELAEGDRALRQTALEIGIPSNTP